MRKRIILWVCDFDAASSGASPNLLRLDGDVETRHLRDRSILRTNADIDLLVLDSGENPETGLQILMDYKKGNPDVPVLFLSDTDAPVWIQRALKFGARDYIIKSTDIRSFQKIIENVLDSGKHSVPPVDHGKADMRSKDSLRNL